MNDEIGENDRNKIPVAKTIDNADIEELKQYYDEILNRDKSTFISSNDEPTPMNCIDEMVGKIPQDLWRQQGLSILDPCCGNGNFSILILSKLLKHHDKQTIVEEILEFNDINQDRLENVRKVFCGDKYNLQITNILFLKISKNTI